MTLQSPEIEQFIQNIASKDLFELRDLSKKVSKEEKNQLKAIQLKRLILDRTNEISLLNMM